ncbi:F-box only protein 21-like [Uloborus diversus]|uniref:F-box only protein 21-like n=1 Tax=Uloborus diversus TaxID=327109 RepID=UPI002409A9A9|nr:F-box only protein 21-like [Uloborus diversus]
MQFKQKEGYFALSPEPRTERSPDIKFRVGQVIVHKVWKYRGVIVGWDETAKAPKEWLKVMHGEKHKHWKDMPNYSILVDTRDKLIPQIGYVPQENIEVVTNMRVLHPLLDDHFENFDGAQYIPRPWLKALYPQD